MWTRKRILLALLLLALVCTARHLCAALLDGVRHTVDLSFTIEWGPTYWVDYCMAALGRPGIERLCATTVDNKEHVARGAQYALASVRNPAYARLFIATVNSPTVHPLVRDSLLRHLCQMPNEEATEFIKSFIRDENQPECDLQTVVLGLAYRKDLLPLVKEITTWQHRPALVGAALLGRAQIDPENCLRDFIAFVCDEKQPRQIREKLFSWYASGQIVKPLPKSINDNLEEILRPTLTVNKPDRTPDEDIRSDGRRVLSQYRRWERLRRESGGGA